MWTIFKVFIEFITITSLFYILVFWAQGMWDLSSMTRNWTHSPSIERWNLKHWTTREVPWFDLLRHFLSEQPKTGVSLLYYWKLFFDLNISNSHWFISHPHELYIGKKIKVPNFQTPSCKWATFQMSTMVYTGAKLSLEGGNHFPPSLAFLWDKTAAKSFDYIKPQYLSARKFNLERRGHFSWTPLQEGTPEVLLYGFLYIYACLGPSTAKNSIMHAFL